MTKQFATREEWLMAAAGHISTRFNKSNYVVPGKVKASCGWPVGSRGTSKTILGQCWAPEASADGSHEIFVAPLVSDPLIVLGVLAHELVHAAVGVKHGHKRPFIKACDTLGLTGKPTQAMPGPKLAAWIKDVLLPKLGPYPHAILSDSARKKQTTRMVKLVCLETGYTVRTSRKWIEHGLPTSPAGHVMQVEGGDEEEGED